MYYYNYKSIYNKIQQESIVNCENIYNKIQQEGVVINYPPINNKYYISLITYYLL